MTGTGDAGPPGEGTSRQYLIEVLLDEASLANPNPDIEHERQVAIFDLLEHNFFNVLDRRAGPYVLRLSAAERRLVFEIGTSDGEQCATIILSMSPFQRLVKDYFLVCESYFAAIKTASPSRIEAIDMGRRGLHDEGSQLLLDRLEGKIEMDFATARRLFTLICSLHWKG